VWNIFLRIRQQARCPDWPGDFTDFFIACFHARAPYFKKGKNAEFRLKILEFIIQMSGKSSASI